MYFTGWQLKNGHLRNESVKKALYLQFPALLKRKANQNKQIKCHLINLAMKI